MQKEALVGTNGLHDQESFEGVVRSLAGSFGGATEDEVEAVTIDAQLVVVGSSRGAEEELVAGTSVGPTSDLFPTNHFDLESRDSRGFRGRPQELPTQSKAEHGHGGQDEPAPGATLGVLPLSFFPGYSSPDPGLPISRRLDFLHILGQTSAESFVGLPGGEAILAALEVRWERPALFEEEEPLPLEATASR